MKAALALLGHLLRMDRFAGYRTYLAAAGLVGLSVYLLSQGDAEGAVQRFLEAMGLLGLREGIRAAAGPVVIVPPAAAEPKG